MADQIDPSSIAKARAAGYSDTEIADYLAKSSPGVGKAREAGYADKEIVAHLSGDAASPEPSAAAAPPAEEPSTLKDVAMQIPTGFNEGLADTVGAPIDALSWALRKAGLPIPASAFGGSQSIKNGLGLINANPDNAPAQTTAGQFARTAGGTVASSMIPEAAVATMGRAGLMAPQALKTAQAVVGDGSNMLGTAATGAAAGLGSEAAGQATEGTAAEPFARMAGGALVGAAAGRLAAARSATPKLALPDADAVKAEATRLYNDPAVKDLRIHPGAVNSLGDDIAASLDNRGMFREDHAPVYNAIDRLSGANGPVSFDQLDAVRKALGSRAGEVDAFGRSTPTAAAASHARGMLDDFIGNDMTQPANVLQGNPVAARVFIHNARQNSGAAIRSEQVANKLANAEIDNAGNNSALNGDNKSRQSLKTFLKNDEAKMGGYNDDERAAMRSHVFGDYLRNTLRYAGNAIGGSGITVGPYVLTGHPVLPAVGYALKKTANMLAQRSGNNLVDQLLARAPLVRRVAAQNNAITAANAAAAKQKMLQAALRSAAATGVQRLYVSPNRDGN